VAYLTNKREFGRMRRNASDIYFFDYEFSTGSGRRRSKSDYDPA
jgi:hypothetical protein